VRATADQQGLQPLKVEFVLQERAQDDIASKHIDEGMVIVVYTRYMRIASVLRKAVRTHDTGFKIPTSVSLRTPLALCLDPRPSRRRSPPERGKIQARFACLGALGKFMRDRP
jgi:hypothetical protein